MGNKRRFECTRTRTRTRGRLDKVIRYSHCEEYFYIYLIFLTLLVPCKEKRTIEIKLEQQYVKA